MKTHHIKKEQIPALKNFVEIIPIIHPLLIAYDGLLGLDEQTILGFIENAKEIRVQKCLIDCRQPKYAHESCNDIPEEIKKNIRTNLQKQFSDEGVFIKSNAQKRITIIAGNISLSISDAIHDILSNDVEYSWALNASKNKTDIMKVGITILDIYE